MWISTTDMHGKDHVFWVGNGHIARKGGFVSYVPYECRGGYSVEIEYKTIHEANTVFNKIHDLLYNRDHNLYEV